ncbi:metallophosphoesterase family protein [Janthinobacterium agaricidamnosum]|uniref:Calcineurin-like phosphoesterase family protein n=1 Tax=Janthinobacterium agaricidamnosum NBRC 102515 = DSM 9628 TaxID=1349767 RepID=W0UYX8_9BURK|nr:metallophosphoesterase family protein [Janthinobacterium agaricidamnosum]CDG80846.1 calcineurin-like phosphoesterase family protein [Janthinobacterium agaricidamnosum NBRC 102515 = DSM 9628]
MRIAAISDIHGNLGALDAVLADIARRGVDLTVNLGDILSGGLQPRATADRLMMLDFPTIKGNHERQVLAGDPSRMDLSDRYAYDTLRPDQLRWIASLPATLRLPGEVLLVHGTPSSDLVYFLDTVTPDGSRAATLDEVASRAGDTPAALILCGHTHLPRRVRLADGRLIANPGSVGLPAYDDDHPFPHKMENGTPHARYAIAERTADGAWSVEPVAVAYDWDGAAALALANGRPDWAHALKTGHAGASPG